LTDSLSKIVLLGVVVVVSGLSIWLATTDFFYPETQLTNEIKQAEAYSSIMFSSNIIFYDKEDRRNTFQNKQVYNCGGQRDDSPNLLECLRIHENDVIVLSWWQIIDGKWKGMHLPCNNGMVCLEYDNKTAFLFVEIEDPSIVLDVDQILKMNQRIIDVQNYKDWNDPNFKVITVEVDDLNDLDQQILPSITLFFPSDFENKCLFSSDRITCDMQQEILKELKRIG